MTWISTLNKIYHNKFAIEKESMNKNLWLKIVISININPIIPLGTPHYTIHLAKRIPGTNIGKDNVTISQCATQRALASMSRTWFGSKAAMDPQIIASVPLRLNVSVQEVSHYGGCGSYAHGVLEGPVVNWFFSTTTQDNRENWCFVRQCPCLFYCCL